MSLVCIYVCVARAVLRTPPYIRYKRVAPPPSFRHFFFPSSHVLQVHLPVVNFLLLLLLLQVLPNNFKGLHNSYQYQYSALPLPLPLPFPLLLPPPRHLTDYFTYTVFLPANSKLHHYRTAHQHLCHLYRRLALSCSALSPPPYITLQPPASLLFLLNFAQFIERLTNPLTYIPSLIKHRDIYRIIGCKFPYDSPTHRQSYSDACHQRQRRLCPRWSD